MQILTDNSMINVKELYKDWAQKIHQTADQLQTAISATEEDFLSIGELLNDFYMKSIDITTWAAEAAGNLTNEHITQAIEEIGTIVDKLQSFTNPHEEENTVCRNHLTSMRKTLKPFDKLLGEVVKVAQILTMLGIDTRIESARLGNDEFGFAILAKDIRNLALLISSRVKTIADKIEVFDNLLEDTCEHVSEQGKISRLKIRKTLHGIRKNLDDLRELYRISSEIARNCEYKAKTVSDHIGEVVLSLQFHDITRQQAEHVAEALRHIAAVLEEDAENMGEISRDELPMLELIRETASICELQQAQLGNSSRSFTTAVEAIIQNLVSISRETEKITSDSEIMAGQGENSLLTEVEHGISEALNSLMTAGQLQRELGEIIRNTAERTGEIEKILGNIEETGENIELIALNAQVKAARTGEEGTALGIIAESIQKISNESRLNTAKLQKTLTEVLQSANVLKDGADSQIKEDQSFLDNILADFSEISTELHKVEQETTPIRERINNRQMDLVRQINETITGITFHNTAARAFNQAADELIVIQQQILEMAPSLEYKGHVGKLADLNKLYTMESEREVHQTVAGTLISENFDPDLYSFSNAADAEFGDNVELF